MAPIRQGELLPIFIKPLGQGTRVQVVGQFACCSGEFISSRSAGRRNQQVARTCLVGPRLFAPASARRLGSLLPAHGIARRLIACPGCVARSFMAATSS
jgi:hypothetical protein